MAAATQFPGPFSPTANWISHLGNYDLNPAGAILYNACAFITGLLLIPFFTGLAAWYYEAKKDRYFYVGSELFGLIAALGMIMHSVFQEGTSLHHLWAVVCFVSMVIVLLLANWGLLRHPRFNKILGYFGLFAALAGLIFFVMFIGMRDMPMIMVWLAVYSGFLWVLLFSYNAVSEQGMTVPVPRKHKRSV